MIQSTDTARYAGISCGCMQKEGRSLVEKLIDIGSCPVAQVLDALLQDKTTKKNIIWATDTYEDLGNGFAGKAQIDANAILRRPELICPRIQKPQDAQADRTRKKAEVFMKMSNLVDTFLTKSVFTRPRQSRHSIFLF